MNSQKVILWSKQRVLNAVFKLSGTLVGLQKYLILGPNVSIGKNVKVGAGARIRESIILGNSVIGDHSLVIYSVIGRF